LIVLQPSRLSEVDGDRVMGITLCPFSPVQNSTSLMTSFDDLYTATVTDFTARDPAIYRALGPSKHLRTVQYNSRWLNGQYNNEYRLECLNFWLYLENDTR